MAAPDILTALHPIADAFDALGVRWHICGLVAPERTHWSLMRTRASFFSPLAKTPS